MVKKGVILVISSLLVGSVLWAGGWNNTLMGARAMALGGAFVGIADDASAIYFNPAGLVFQKKAFNFSIDGFYIWPTHEYTMPTGTKAQSKYNIPLPQIFLTYRTSEKITLGIGMYVPYAGGGVDWKKDQLGFPLESYLAIYAISPTLAYQISDELSLGFNLIYYRGIHKLNTEYTLYEFAPPVPMEAEENGSALSAGFGLIFKPSEKISLGMSIRGPAKMKLSGITSLNYGGLKLNLDSETSYNLPWDVEVGLSYKVTENFLLATSVQYTMWSALDKVKKTIKSFPLIGDVKKVEDMDFKNILTWRAGFEYILPQGIALRAGIGLDRYATPEETLNITNIDVNKLTLLGGIGYKAGRMQIDFTYIYAFGKEREKISTEYGLPLTEKYNLNVFILGLGVTYSY